MSDESQPPPLRLRPRVRNEEAAAATPPPVTPPTPAAASAPESGSRLRLKPKLMAEAEPEAAMPAAPVDFAPPPAPFQPPAPAAVDLVLPVVTPEIPPPPPVVVSPPEPLAETDVLPRLKLKPFPATIAGAGAEASSPVADDLGAEPPPPAPTMKPLSVIKIDAPVPPPPAVPPGVLGGALVSPPRVAFKPPARASRLSLGRVLIMAGVLLVLAGGGYYAYLMFFAEPPAPAPRVVVKKTPPPPTMVAPPVVGAPAMTSPAAVVPEKTVVPPASAVPPPPPAVVKVAVKTPPAPPPPAPSAEFLAWVDAVKISGVFNGSSPRAIVNGLLVRPGETIDASRGILFDHVDTTRKEFFFRDRSGAVTSKNY